MELNFELLESIIYLRADSPSGDTTDGPAANEVTETSTGPVGTQRETLGNGSIRLKPKQVLEIASGDSTAPDAWETNTRDISEKSMETPRVAPTPRGSGNLTPRGSLQFDDHKQRKRKTLFDALSDKHGMENAMRWFESNCPLFEREMSEAQFIQFILNLTNFLEWEAYETFDILDRRHTGTVSWDAFYILISLYTAYHSKRLTKFLYKHGSSVFQFLLDPVTKRLNFERFSRLGFLIGLSEDDILETCLLFGIRKNAMEMIGQEDFLLFYFAIFNTIDTGVDLLLDNQSIPVGGPSNKPPGLASVGGSKGAYAPATGHGPGAGRHQAQKCVIS